MVHQRKKDIYFHITKILTKSLYPFHKLKFRGKKNLAIHLGSGHNILPDFINVDGNPTVKNAVYYDIRNKLPFDDNSVNIIYTSNCLEHFYPDELEFILNDFKRVLAKGGIIRIVVPDLEKSIHAYMEKSYSFFCDYPRTYTSYGGRFSNFIFCDAQHKITFDFDYMKELLITAGFKTSQIRRVQFEKTTISDNLYSSITKYEEHLKDTNLFVEVLN